MVTQIASRTPARCVESDYNLLIPQTAETHSCCLIKTNNRTHWFIKSNRLQTTDQKRFPFLLPSDFTNMARLGIIFGLLLCGISIAAMLQTPLKTPSQFYSMMFGIPIFFCGIVSLNPHRRRQSMMIANLLASIGVISGMAWLFLHSPKPTSSPLSVSPYPPIIAMTLTCAFFLTCSVAGFSRNKERSLVKPNEPVQ